jgi:outer membrane murein-binding lipoprotein Lpp
MAKKGILSSFIEIEPKKKSSVAPQAPAAPFFAAPAPVAAPAPGSIQFAQPMSTEDMDKFIAHFEKLMKDANLPGPDYYEFAKVMGTLKAHIHDERELMLAALGSLQAQSSTITKDVLLSSAQHYMGIIQQNRQEFMQTLDAKKKSEMGTRTDEIDELTQKIVADKQQIDQLNKEMESFSAKIQALKAEAAEIEERLGKNGTGYITASDAMISKINGDIEKIKVNV